jgi:BirA family biotin operon repressor/biotin-[acetyl-CoA-carboxylase] ligase
MTWTITRVASAASTMDIAKQQARGGAPDRWAVVAEEMTKGRGTQGRPWHAPRGGLYLSFVLRGLPDPTLVSLALGNAVADVLEISGADPRLKWVNDVWVDGRKIAGILVEGESTGSHVDFLVAGVGINVNGHANSFPAPLDKEATTLEDVLGCDSCVPDLEAVLLHSIDKWLGKLADGEGAQVVAAFRARDAIEGKRVRVGSATHSVEGVAAGIDDHGRLMVRTTAGRTEALHAGTVSVLT